MGVDVKSILQVKSDNLFIQTEPFDCSVSVGSNIITVFGLVLDDDYLIDRTITISEATTTPPSTPPPEPVAPFTETGTYNIISNTTLDGNCLIEVDFTFTEESTEITAMIDDDTLLKASITNTITYLNTPTPSPLIVGRIPTYNDYFYKIDLLSEEIITFVENYQNKDKLYNTYADFSDYALTITQEYVDGLNTVNAINTLLSEITANIQSIDSVFSDNQQYFIRLKTVMADLKIVDLKVNAEQHELYLNSRTTESQTRISSLYNIYLNDGKVGYSAAIQTELYNIKIA